ncbi:ABC transporter permease [Syntrophomonas erecta subsp. sporosyntropha]
MIRKYWYIFKREFTFMWRDKGLRYVLLIGPFLGILIFSLVYKAQILTDIPAAIVDLDRSTYSCDLIRNFASTQNIKVISQPNTYQELQEAIEKGQVVIGLVISEDYGTNINKNQPGKIAMIIDGSNMIYAVNATTAVLTVTQTAGAQVGVKTLLAQGINPKDAANAFRMVDFREEPWFNHSLNYGHFLVLGLVLNIWQQCCMLLAAMTVIGERGLPSWVHFKMSRISKLGLFATKSVVHIIIFMALVTLVYLISFTILKLPINCSLPLLLFFTLGFAVALHSMGTFMSSVARTASDSSRLGLAIAVPAFVLSGYTWPLEAMPTFLAKAAACLPQTGFFQGVVILTMKEGGWAAVSHFFTRFIIFAIVAYLLSIAATAWFEKEANI